MVWLEHDLYDQLQLIQILDTVDGGTDAVEAILPDRFLGEMDVAELSALWPGRAPVRRDQVALAQFAWEAVRAPGPQAIEALLTTHPAALPHLGPALRRHLEELPATGDGLSRTERQALEAIRRGRRTPLAIFVATQRAEEAPFLGDTWMWARLAALGSGEERLVETAAGDAARTAAAAPRERRLHGAGDRAHRPRPRRPRRRGRPLRPRPARPLARAASTSPARSPRGAGTARPARAVSASGGGR